jgi:hypothetical protein
MSVDPEQQLQSEISEPYPTPSLVFEENIDPDLKAQLILDHASLVEKPAVGLVALQAFARMSPDKRQDSRWQRLTDRTIARYYEFDEATETEIYANPHVREIIESGRQKMSAEGAEEASFKIRVARLEVFLQRLRTHKNLGAIAVNE